MEIFVSFDMGWNKRSSGNRYDSFLGHALLIGCLSKKIVTGIVSNRICRQCSKAEENGEEPPKYICPRNYNSSSKAMETDVALHLYKEIFETSNNILHLKANIVDGYSSMRVLLNINRIIRKVDCLRK